MIHIVSDPRYKIHAKQFKKSTESHLADRGFGSEFLLTVIFVGKRKMKSIAATYKHENIALPVLSFSYIKEAKSSQGDAEEKLLGEVFICYPQAVLLAAEREKRVDDMIVSLIEHGIETILS